MSGSSLQIYRKIRVKLYIKNLVRILLKEGRKVEAKSIYSTVDKVVKCKADWGGGITVWFGMDKKW